MISENGLTKCFARLQEGGRRATTDTTQHQVTKANRELEALRNQMWSLAEVALCTQNDLGIAASSFTVHTAISLLLFQSLFRRYLLKKLIPLSFWKKKRTKALF